MKELIFQQFLMIELIFKCVYLRQVNCNFNRRECCDLARTVFKFILWERVSRN